MILTRKRIKGFTLIELLLVIAVIGMLAALLTPALQSSRERARQTACKNNLHQLSIALIMYKDDMKDFPNWLSDLSPRYIGKGSEDVFVCKSDIHRGKDEYACKPSELLDLTTADRNYNKVSDNNNDTSLNRTNNIYACSYMYEFSAAPCDAWSWDVHVNNSTNLPANATWKEVKKCQLAYGDVVNASYSESLFPVIRCYHHWKERTVETTSTNNPKEGLTLNVSYAGNIYEGPLTWEYTK
jgi:prepilin-type N-terminal cleavage/methylation domain-containing protein